MNKLLWKTMMYSKPTWYYIARSTKSKSAHEAADEYEEEMGSIGVELLSLVLIALGIFAISKLTQSF